VFCVRTRTCLARVAAADYIRGASHAPPVLPGVGLGPKPSPSIFSIATAQGTGGSTNGFDNCHAERSEASRMCANETLSRRVGSALGDNRKALRSEPLPMWLQGFEIYWRQTGRRCISP